jgi:hypothetical protein
VIQDGYEIAHQVQCSDGSVPNWVTLSALSSKKPWEGLSFTCSFSGTEAKNYGADASRAPWRVCHDYYLYGSASDATLSDGTKYGAKAFCNALAKNIMDYCLSTPNCTEVSQFSACQPFTNAFHSGNGTCLSPYGDSVTSVDAAQLTAYMFAPILTAFAVPVDGYESVQRAFLKKFLQWGAEQFIENEVYFDLAQLIISYSLIGGLFGPATVGTSSPTTSPPTPVLHFKDFLTVANASSYASAFNANYESKYFSGAYQLPSTKSSDAVAVDSSLGVTSKNQATGMLIAAAQQDTTNLYGLLDGWKSMANGGYAYICDACGGTECSTSNPDNLYQGVCVNDAALITTGTSTSPSCCNCLTVSKTIGFMPPASYSLGIPSQSGGSVAADQDAITAMIFLAEQTNDNAVRSHALYSIIAFILQDIGYGTDADVRTYSGSKYYALKVWTRLASLRHHCHSDRVR